MPRIEESPPQLRPPGDVALELSSVLHFTLLVARIPAGIVPIGLCRRTAGPPRWRRSPAWRLA